MEIKYFRLIKTIAEEGSIANSSEKLFLTQSALSHQLRELELQLGFKVFLRTRQNWVLTDEGKALNQLGNEVLERIENGFQNIQNIRNGSSGQVKVGTECYSFYHNLPKFIQKMGVLYPEIKVDLVLEATHQPVSKLLSREIDIAIMTIKVSHDLLTSIPIFEDEVFAVMHPEHELNCLDFLEAKHFSSVNLIIHSFPLETVSIHENFLKPNKITPKKIIPIPLTEVALEMVMANMGVMCMPIWALESFKDDHNLVYKKITKGGLKRMHYLALHQTDMTKKYINDFIINFKENFIII